MNRSRSRAPRARQHRRPPTPGPDATVMDIGEIKSKSIPELHEMAEKLSIQNFAGLRKQDLIFKIEQNLLDNETVLQIGRAHV